MSAFKPAPVSGRSALPSLGLDPRTVFATMVLVNIIVLSRAPNSLILACMSLTLLLLATEAELNTLVGYIAVLCINASLMFVIPTIWSNGLAVLLGFAGFWLFRFTIVIGFAMFAVASFNVSKVAAVLTQIRAPAWLYIPILVMIRFFPVAVAELRAINNALLLRGLRPGVTSLFAHPIRTGELVVIPFLASCARIADELAAAALLKGVGSTCDRTCVIQSRFKFADGLFFSADVVLIVWTVGSLYVFG